MQYGTLEDTLYLWFASNDTAGSGDDGATPLADVRLAGATISDAPILSPTPALLSHANYPAGCYELAVAATAANGFAAGNTYAVFCSLTVDSQNPTGFVGAFKLAPVISDLRQMGGVAQSASDLKDFADDGYDPSANKVQGVVLVDTLTTYTGNTVQSGDSFARIGATGSGLTSLASAADLATVDGNVDDIETLLNLVALDVDEILTDTGTTIPGTLANLALEATAQEILTDTGTAIPGLIAALNNLSAAQVNAEIVDALAVDTYAEPGQGNPAATASLAAKINYGYKWQRNLITNDGSVTNFYNDAGDTVDQKRTTSEAGGTVTKGEIVTGP